MSLRKIISEAITRAENDKLEAAARWVEMLASDLLPQWVINEIRALKKD